MKTIITKKRKCISVGDIKLFRGSYLIWWEWEWCPLYSYITTQGLTWGYGQITVYRLFWQHKMTHDFMATTEIDCDLSLAQFDSCA